MCQIKEKRVFKGQLPERGEIKTEFLTNATLRFQNDIVNPVSRKVDKTRRDFGKEFFEL